MKIRFTILRILSLPHFRGSCKWGGGKEFEIIVSNTPSTTIHISLLGPWQASRFTYLYIGCERMDEFGSIGIFVFHEKWRAVPSIWLKRISSVARRHVGLSLGNMIRSRAGETKRALILGLTLTNERTNESIQSISKLKPRARRKYSQLVIRLACKKKLK